MAPRQPNNGNDGVPDIGRMALENMGLDPDDDLTEGADGTDDDGLDDTEREEAAKLPAEDDNEELYKALNIHLGDREEPKPKADVGKKPTEQPIPRPSRYETDKKGNVIDPRTGNILAAAGAPARMFKDLQAARVTASKAQGEVTRVSGLLDQTITIARNLNAKVLAFKEANESFSKQGLTPTEAVEAATLYGAMKKGGEGAVTALKNILTRAAASGIDLKSLGLGAGSFDPATLAAELKKTLDPVLQSVQRRDEAERTAEETRQEIERVTQETATHVVTFFRNTPAAVPHMAAIKRLLDDPRMADFSLREIWLTYKDYLRDHPELQQRQRGGNRNGDGGRAPPTPPSGRRPVAPRNGATEFDRPAPAGMSQQDIINEVLDHFVGTGS